MLDYIVKKHSQQVSGMHGNPFLLLLKKHPRMHPMKLIEKCLRVCHFSWCFMEKLVKCFFSPKPSSSINAPSDVAKPSILWCFTHPSISSLYLFERSFLPSEIHSNSRFFLVVHGCALGCITCFRMHRQLYTMLWWVLAKYARFDCLVTLQVIGFVRAKSLFASRWLAWLVCLATSYLACFHHLLW